MYFGSECVCCELFDKNNRLESCLFNLLNELGDVQKSRLEIINNHDKYLRDNVHFRLGFIRDVVFYTLDIARLVRL